MKKPNWVEMNSKLATLNEKQVFFMLQAELDTYRRASYLNRLHQRYCALRDARERKEILAKAAALAPKPIYTKEEVALVNKKLVNARRKNEDRRNDEDL